MLARRFALGFLVSTLGGCAAQTESSDEEATVASSAEALTRAPAVEGWQELRFHGRGCDAQFPASSTSNGGDAAFLPGMGVDLAPRHRAHLSCRLGANLEVPKGQYVKSLSYALSYGAVKAEGAHFRIVSDFSLRVADGSGEIEIASPASVALEEPLDIRTVVRDTSASQRHFCGRRTASRVRFDNPIHLDAHAGANGNVVISVDAVDVHAELAPCP